MRVRTVHSDGVRAEAGAGAEGNTAKRPPAGPPAARPPQAPPLRAPWGAGRGGRHRRARPRACGVARRRGWGARRAGRAVAKPVKTQGPRPACGGSGGGEALGQPARPAPPLQGGERLHTNGLGGGRSRRRAKGRLHPERGGRRRARRPRWAHFWGNSGPRAAAPPRRVDAAAARGVRAPGPKGRLSLLCFKTSSKPGGPWGPKTGRMRADGAAAGAWGRAPPVCRAARRWGAAAGPRRGAARHAGRGAPARRRARGVRCVVRGLWYSRRRARASGARRWRGAGRGRAAGAARAGPPALQARGALSGRLLANIYTRAAAEWRPLLHNTCVDIKLHSRFSPAPPAGLEPGVASRGVGCFSGLRGRAHARGAVGWGAGGWGLQLLWGAVYGV